MKNIAKKAITCLAAVGSYAMMTGVALAEVSTLQRPTNLPQAQDVETLIITIITYLLGIAGLVAVIFLIIGGFNYITAQGNEEQTKKATSTLLNAVIGLIVIFAAFAIVYTVQSNILGVDSGVAIQ